MVQFVFPGSEFSKIDKTNFNATLMTAVLNITGTSSLGRVYVSSLTGSSLGFVVANVTFPTSGQQTLLANAISAGQLSFSVSGTVYSASFNFDYGVCPDGSVSPTGYAPGCITCPANTYVCIGLVLSLRT